MFLNTLLNGQTKQGIYQINMILHCLNRFSIVANTFSAHLNYFALSHHIVQTKDYFPIIQN